MSVRVSFSDYEARKLLSTTTDAISRSSIWFWKGSWLERPSVRNSWDAGSVFGKRTRSRRADAAQKKEASRVSLESRQRIQEQATAGRRALSQERKRLEQQRLFDQQRTDIHPSHVQDTLQALSNASAPSSSERSKLLIPAIPEDDTVQTPLVRLAVRKLEENHD